ncbi:MAG: hypothetical protein QOJ30_2862 [Pseudonocardiales bacterium]|jgi:hypothetical protein|nr:hypothetical protein [Pseudonocardiales bacterium]
MRRSSRRSADMWSVIGGPNRSFRTATALPAVRSVQRFASNRARTWPQQKRWAAAAGRLRCSSASDSA